MGNEMVVVLKRQDGLRASRAALPARMEFPALVLTRVRRGLQLVGMLVRQGAPRLCVLSVALR